MGLICIGELQVITVPLDSITEANQLQPSLVVANAWRFEEHVCWIFMLVG